MMQTILFYFLFYSTYIISELVGQANQLKTPTIKTDFYIKYNRAFN